MTSLINRFPIVYQSEKTFQSFKDGEFNCCLGITDRAGAPDRVILILYSTSVRPKCRSLVIKKINEQRTKRKPTTKEQKANKEWLEKGTLPKG